MMISSRDNRIHDRSKVSISRDSHYSDIVSFKSSEYGTPCASDLAHPGHRLSNSAEMNPNRPFNTGIHDWRNWNWQDWPSDFRALPQTDVNVTNPLEIYTTPVQENFLPNRIPEPSPYLNTEHQSRPIHGHWRSNFRSRSASALPTSLAWSPHSQHEPPVPPAPRQIRFVSNDGQPHTKRRRIDKA